MILKATSVAFLAFQFLSLSRGGTENFVFQEFAAIARDKEPRMSTILKQLFRQNVLKGHNEDCFFCGDQFSSSYRKIFDEVASSIYGQAVKHMPEMSLVAPTIVNETKSEDRLQSSVTPLNPFLIRRRRTEPPAIWSTSDSSLFRHMPEMSLVAPTIVNETKSEEDRALSSVTLVNPFLILLRSTEPPAILSTSDSSIFRQEDIHLNDTPDIQDLTKMKNQTLSPPKATAFPPEVRRPKQMTFDDERPVPTDSAKDMRTTTDQMMKLKEADMERVFENKFSGSNCKCVCQN